MSTPKFEMIWVELMDFELEDCVYSRIWDGGGWLDGFRVGGPCLLQNSIWDSLAWWISSWRTMSTSKFEMGWGSLMDFELEDHVYSKIRDGMGWFNGFRVGRPCLLQILRWDGLVRWISSWRTMSTPKFEIKWVGSMNFELEDHIYSINQDRMNWLERFRVGGLYLLQNSRLCELDQGISIWRTMSTPVFWFSFFGYPSSSEDWELLCSSILESSNMVIRIFIWFNIGSIFSRGALFWADFRKVFLPSRRFF